MRQKYTKVQGLIDLIRERKSKRGGTNREIAGSLGVTLKQVKQLIISRANRRERVIDQGYVPRPQGRPRKSQESTEAQQQNELLKLRMQVELLRNFY